MGIVQQIHYTKQSFFSVGISIMHNNEFKAHKSIILREGSHQYENFINLVGKMDQSDSLTKGSFSLSSDKDSLSSPITRVQDNEVPHIQKDQVDQEQHHLSLNAIQYSRMRFYE